MQNFYINKSFIYSPTDVLVTLLKKQYYNLH